MMAGSQEFKGSANDFLDWFKGKEFEKVSTVLLFCVFKVHVYFLLSMK